MSKEERVSKEERDDSFDLSDLEPLTEASAESPESPGALPELPDLAELGVDADELPDLPSAATLVPETRRAPAQKPEPAPRRVPEPSKAATPAAAPKPPAPSPAAPASSAKPSVPTPAAPKPAPAKPPAPPPAASRPAPPRPAPPTAPARPPAPPASVRPAAASAPVRPPAPPASVRPAAPALREEKPAAGLFAAPAPDAPAPATTSQVEPTSTAAPAGAAEPASPVAAAAASSSAEKPDGDAARAGAPRQLDQAPLHLRKAAWVVVAGSLLPWMGSGATWLALVVSKLVVGLGAWILQKTIAARTGAPVPGFVAKLAAVSLAPKPKPAAPEEAEAKPKGKKKKSPLAPLFQALPTAGHAVGLLVLLVGVFSVFYDPAIAAGGEDVYGIKAFAEVGMLAWAAATIVHIFSYVHGGRFNPIFPLMFLAMFAAGILGAIGAFAEESPVLLTVRVAGALVVSAGGGIACYTIFEAMKQAKVEGEAKKAAAREARKAARGSGTGARRAR